jgi:hypothetical protein
MARIRYAPKLFGEFVRFAMERKAYWLIPLALLLGATALLVVVTQAVAPMIYTLF